MAQKREGQAVTRRPRHRFRNGVFVLPALLALSLILCCAERNAGNPLQADSLRQLLTPPGPKTVVVLPFEAPEEEPGIGDLARETFYSHFSLKNYRDIEPARVDRVLESRAGPTKGAWKDLSPAELGELFRADFLLYGKVLDYQRTFLGIYSQIAITVGLEMVSCESGEGVWQKTLTKRSHEGGLSFSLLEVIPAALRSSLHMRHKRTVGLVDRICRELAEAIPEPPLAPLEVHSLGLQVASFLERGRAEATLSRFEAWGMECRIESVTVDGRRFHRVLVGPFAEAADAEGVRKRIEEETSFSPVLIRHDGGFGEGGG